jgi:hypothetical protein
MEILVDKQVLQPVICLKDSKFYVFKIDENPSYIKEDYGRIRCYLVKEDGEPDFSKEIEIYGKYLVAAD